MGNVDGEREPFQERKSHVRHMRMSGQEEETSAEEVVQF
jgi:hypothetical protein